MADFIWLVKEFVFGTLLLPLRWMPTSAIAMLRVCIVVFSFVVVGRILKWLWDALPLV